MVQGKLLSYGDDISDALSIRKEVFVEEMGIPEEVEFDEYDDYSIHVIIYEENLNNYAVATGRIMLYNQTCFIDKICVLKNYRGKYYGDFAVRMLIFQAFQKGFNEVKLKCNKDQQDFFEKIGFEVEQELNYNYVKMKINEKNVEKKCDKCRKIQKNEKKLK